MKTWLEDGLLRTGHEWCKIHNITIIDPDGWRRNDGVTLETEITEEDFRKRVAVCTITLTSGVVGSVMDSIRAEMRRQDNKWGEQRSNPLEVEAWVRNAIPSEISAKLYVDEKARTDPNGPSWAAILLEEIAEAFNAETPEHQLTELVQCAAVLAQWAKYLKLDIQRNA